MKIVHCYKKNAAISHTYVSGVELAKSRFGKNAVVLTSNRSKAKEFADAAAVKAWFKENKLTFRSSYSIDTK